MDLINEVLITPFLTNFGILPQDPTFGRYLLDTSQTEIDFEARQHITTRRRRVFFKNANVSSTKIKGYAKGHIEAPAVGNATQQEYVEVEEGEDVDLTKGELASGKGRQWVFYKVWESNSFEAQNGKGRGCDVVFSHGKYSAVIPHWRISLS
jgi:acylglycerol lipase